MVGCIMDTYKKPFFNLNLTPSPFGEGIWKVFIGAFMYYRTKLINPVIFT